MPKFVFVETKRLELVHDTFKEAEKQFRGLRHGELAADTVEVGWFCEETGEEGELE